jgi:hypothetical protein
VRRESSRSIYLFSVVRPTDSRCWLISRAASGWPNLLLLYRQTSCELPQSSIASHFSWGLRFGAMRLFIAAWLLSTLGVVTPNEDVQGIPDGCFKTSRALTTARKKRDARINKDILNCRNLTSGSDCIDNYEGTKMYRDFKAACVAARGSFQMCIRDMECEEFPWEPEMYNIPECFVSQKVNSACDPDLLVEIESFIDIEGCEGYTFVERTVDYYVAPMKPAVKPHMGPVMRPAARPVRRSLSMG